MHVALMCCFWTYLVIESVGRTRPRSGCKKELRVRRNTQCRIRFRVLAKPNIRTCLFYSTTEVRLLIEGQRGGQVANKTRPSHNRPIIPVFEGTWIRVYHTAQCEPEATRLLSGGWRQKLSDRAHICVVWQEIPSVRRQGRDSSFGSSRTEPLTDGYFRLAQPCLLQ